MNEKIRVLLIESNPLIIQAYERALKLITSKNENLKFKIDKADNYHMALSQLKKAKDHIDIVFLDVRLLYSNDSVFLSGEYVGLKIREEYNNLKLIVSTSYHNSSRILNLIKNIRPDGFLIKNDITVKVLTDAINNVILAQKYFSKSVLNVVCNNSF